MIKLDEAGGFAVVSSLFVCRYERRYAAGEGSFSRKVEILRRRAGCVFTNYISKKSYIRKKIETEFVTKKQCDPVGSTAFCCLR